MKTGHILPTDASSAGDSRSPYGPSKARADCPQRSRTGKTPALFRSEQRQRLRWAFQSLALNHIAAEHRGRRQAVARGNSVADCQQAVRLGGQDGQRVDVKTGDQVQRGAAACRCAILKSANRSQQEYSRAASRIENPPGTAAVESDAVEHVVGKPGRRIVFPQAVADLLGQQRLDRIRRTGHARGRVRRTAGQTIRRQPRTASSTQRSRRPSQASRYQAYWGSRETPYTEGLAQLARLHAPQHIPP